ncbi:U32 family peptidase [Heliobacterium undosum]|uniref:U32 family peptidase n=1 Tax=Heliomicrobium undosum TaxID=121734 RepID=A0A845L1M6_9FIRM|nr:U32 family peptidase [Heliomicrobium undosum]MZP28909.1 U32 family peptidase [Heliomicrobium undosum]
MNILAPIRSLEETAPLIAAGAQELYCGMQPGPWLKRSGRHQWINRREPGKGNLDSPAALQALVDQSHRLGVPVFLALNQTTYAPEMYPDLITLLKEVSGGTCGSIDAVIAADPGLIIAIKEALPDLPIHVSSMAAVLNRSAALFFRSLGVSRIIFPRYLPLSSMEGIIQAAGPDMEYEAFLLNDGCVFEESFCHACHAFGGAFCHNPIWFYRLVRTKGELSEAERRAFEGHLDDYRDWIRHGIKNSGVELSPSGIPTGMCGLCALPALRSLGVTSLKIVGRESSLEKKTASVHLVKGVLDLLDSPAPLDIADFQAKAKASRGTCFGRYTCYYRDV